MPTSFQCLPPTQHDMETTIGLLEKDTCPAGPGFWLPGLRAQGSRRPLHGLGVIRILHSEVGAEQRNTTSLRALQIIFGARHEKRVSHLGQLCESRLDKHLH